MWPTTTTTATRADAQGSPPASTQVGEADLAYQGDGTGLTDA